MVAECQALMYHSLSLYIKSVMSGIRNILNSQQNVIFEELCRLSGCPSFDGGAKFELTRICLSDTAWQRKSSRPAGSAGRNRHE
jgi:hypothetical protein